MRNNQWLDCTQDARAGRKALQSEEVQLESAMKLVRLCHSKMFALKSGAETIDASLLNSRDQSDYEEAMEQLTQLFDEYGTLKNTRSIPGLKGLYVLN